jgi:hypothetical protein
MTADALQARTELVSNLPRGGERQTKIKINKRQLKVGWKSVFGCGRRRRMFKNQNAKKPETWNNGVQIGWAI